MPRPAPQWPPRRQQKPLSDAALEAKFTDLADGILKIDQARRVMDMCWGIEKSSDAGALAAAASR